MSDIPAMPPSGATPSASAPATPSKEYDAFISYKQATESRLASVLRNELHTFAKPWYRLRAVRVFLDRSNLDGNPRLWRSIETAVRASRHFIYLASPEAAASPWVQQELTDFLRINPPERLIILLAAGDIEWNRAARDFDWERTTAMPRLETGLITPDTSPLSDTLYHDVRWARGREDLSSSDPELRDLVATVSATLRGVSKDQLAGDDVRLQKRALRLARGAAATLLLLVVGLIVASGWALVQQRRAVQRLARSYVQQGMRLVDGGNPAAALPWLAEAWSLERRRPADDVNHRVRVAAAAADAPRTVRVWTPGVPVWDARFSPDGAQVLATGGDAPDAFEGSMFGAELGGWGGETSRRGSVHVWQTASGRESFPALRHGGAITAAGFDSSGSVIYSASLDGTARLWNARTGAPLRRWAHPAPVEYAELSGDGTRLLTVSDSVRILSTRTPARITTLSSREAKPFLVGDTPPGARFAADGQRVLLVGERDVGAWDPRTGRVTRYPVPVDSVYGGRFSPDGRRFVLLPVDGSTRDVVVVDALTGAVQYRLPHRDGVAALAFSADGSRMATAYGVETDAGSMDGASRAWNAETGHPLTPWISHLQAGVAVDFSPDGRWAVAGSSDGTAVVFPADSVNPDSLSLLTTPMLHGQEVRSVDFAPDGRHVLTASRDGTVRVWSVTRRALKRAVVNRPFREDTVAAASSDGRWTARVEGGATEEDSTTRVRMRGPNGVDYVFSIPGFVTQMFFTPGAERLLVTGSEEGPLFWDTRSGRRSRRQPLRGIDLPHAADLSADGRWIAAGGWENYARVWNASTGAAVTPPMRNAPSNQHFRSIQAVRFSPDGLRVATLSEDARLRLWDARTGEPLSPVLRAPQGAHQVWFSRDGFDVTVRDHDGNEWTWMLRPQPGEVARTRLWAQIASFQRIDETGAPVLLEFSQFRRRWNEFHALPPRR